MVRGYGSGVWLRGMVRGYGSGYGSGVWGMVRGYGSGVWFGGMVPGYGSGVWFVERFRGMVRSGSTSHLD